MLVSTLEFVLGGKLHRVNRSAVAQKLKGFKPRPIRTHVVRIDGKSYPVKEAFAHVSGIDPLDFNTNQARNWFKRLGFDVFRTGKEEGEK